MSLTKRQREILTYLETYTEEHGYAPSFEEIATQFNYNSLATVHEHLTNLERKGYIKRAYNESRGIELVPSEIFPRAASLPLLGTVAAGMPIEAIQMPESIGVPEDLVRRSGNHFVLRVRGNSMIDEQIRDGDFAPLLQWLRGGIHQHGRKYEPGELVQRVAGADVDPGPYLDYLERKYGEIYGLHAA